MSVLPPGREAPEIDVLDHHRRKRRLQDFRGDHLALVFHRGTQDPDSVMILERLRDKQELFRSRGIRIAAISTEDIEVLARFASDRRIEFPLLSDIDGEAAETFGVHDGTGAKRVTFLIDDTGGIDRTYEDPDPKLHADELLQDAKFFTRTMHRGG
ncbi:MAG: redoxin domain-containing protein [Euryarchaeota archaeon]|nr:redoxin domain-containing protein [Euryarchaeota archaeon]